MGEVLNQERSIDHVDWRERQEYMITSTGNSNDKILHACKAVGTASCGVDESDF